MFNNLSLTSCEDILVHLRNSCLLNKQFIVQSELVNEPLRVFFSWFYNYILKNIYTKSKHDTILTYAIFIPKLRI